MLMLEKKLSINTSVYWKYRNNSYCAKFKNVSDVRNYKVLKKIIHVKWNISRMNRGFFSPIKNYQSPHIFELIREFKLNEIGFLKPGIPSFTFPRHYVIQS